MLLWHCCGSFGELVFCYAVATVVFGGLMLVCSCYVLCSCIIDSPEEGVIGRDGYR